MSPQAVIALVCVVGIVIEALRVRRPGQLFLAPGLSGGYRLGAVVTILSGRRLTVMLVPVLPLGPALRFGDPGPDHASLPVAASTLDQARERLQRVQRACTPLLAPCWVMFIYLTLLVPTALLLSVVPYAWIVLGASLAVVQVWLNVTFWLAYRALHPEHPWSALHHMFTFLLFPPAAVLACERVAAEAIDGIHPLTAVMALLPADEARRFVARRLREWQYPLAGEDGLPAAEQLAAFREFAFAALPGLAGEVAPPVAGGPDSVAYCPRCLAQFTAAGGECPDCPGVGVRAFAG